jgi:hypothetical protein
VNSGTAEKVYTGIKILSPNSSETYYLDEEGIDPTYGTAPIITLTKSTVVRKQNLSIQVSYTTNQKQIQYKYINGVQDSTTGNTRIVSQGTSTEMVDTSKIALSAADDKIILQITED